MTQFNLEEAKRITGMFCQDSTIASAFMAAERLPSAIAEIERLREIVAKCEREFARLKFDPNPAALDPNSPKEGQTT